MTSPSLANRESCGDQRKAVIDCQKGNFATTQSFASDSPASLARGVPLNGSVSVRQVRQEGNMRWTTFETDEQALPEQLQLSFLDQAHQSDAAER